MKPFKLIQSFFKSAFFTYGLFWSWNLLFVILFFWLEVQSSFIVNMIRDVFQGAMPADLAFFGLFALSLPIICIILGFTKFKTNQQKLLHLFYGVEGPLLLFCLLRISILRELTGGTTHLLLLALIGGIFYFYGLIAEDKIHKKAAYYLNYIGHICMLLIGILIAAILSFYVLPMIWGFFHLLGEIIENIRWRDLAMMGFFGTLFCLFFFYTATLFVFTPVVLPFIYGKAFQKSFIKSKQFLGQQKAILVLLATIVFNLFLFIILNWNQSQNKAFELLAEPAQTAEKQRQLIENEEEIREGLLNAYLAQYRYISSVDNNNHIEEMYKQSIGFSESAALVIQEGYNVLIKPFLYEGNMREDRIEAMKQYEAFFDRPLDKFEKEAISSAIEATWDRDGVEASLLNINEEKVLLKKQSVNIQENRQFATVELHEIYQNQTFNREEIFYYFSLPETAVITGLWLSDDDSTKKKFLFRVSPRGAAQEVYKQEVQRRVDPSLLEQVGPRQYRLRAFPILPKSRIYTQRNRGDIVEGPNFHLWLQYKLPLNGSEIDLPELLERRNVYWDESTVLEINGKSINKKDEWYPKSHAQQKKNSFKETYTQLQDSVTIKTSKTELSPNELRLENIAVYIDQTYSMKDQKEAVKETLSKLKTEFKTAAIDVFTAQGEVQKFSVEAYNEDLQREESKHFSCFGNKDYLTALHELSSVLKQETYDFILVLTDEGSYELMVDSVPAYASKSPIYLFHLGQKLPAVYSDAEIETIEKSNGKSVLSIEELVHHQVFKNLQKENPNYIDVADGLLFEVTDQDSSLDDEDFVAIAARQYLKRQSKELNKVDRLTVMDEIHSIAQSIGFVSPYSSMIVLVNKRQHKALDEAEAKEDRFDREVENGGANLTVPGNPFEVSGTPEPEEWMLIGIIACLLGFSMLKGRLF